jgi:hypothetical protein
MAFVPQEALPLDAIQHAELPEKRLHAGVECLTGSVARKGFPLQKSHLQPSFGAADGSRAAGRSTSNH